MPVFDVIRINQDHVAKVLVARQNQQITTNESNLIGGFNKWRKHIRKELKNSQRLSTHIEHVFN